MGKMKRAYVLYEMSKMRSVTQVLNTYNKVIMSVVQDTNTRIDLLLLELDVLCMMIVRVSDLYKACKYKKGRGCSFNGKKYEQQVLQVVRKLYHDDVPFCTETETACSGAEADIVCEYNDAPIPIEVKVATAPDWMQLSIKPRKTDSGIIWRSEGKSKNGRATAEIFEAYIGDAVIFGGELPPPMIAPMSHDDWVALKASTKQFNDFYIPCDDPDLISRLYAAKGCYYIQMSRGYGLYHTGRDVCGFGVPKFSIPCRLRVRTKITGKKANQSKKVRLFVGCAAIPISIKNLPISPYTLDSLDDPSRIPPTLSI